MTGLMGLFLYHHNSSVCAAKIRVALAEKSLPWEGRLLKLDGDQFDPKYLSLNANAVVPTLLHNERVVTESNVILEYIEDEFPTPSLRPAESFARAEMRLLMGMLDGGASGIHYAASVATYAIAYRHHLIRAAGSESRDALGQEIRRRMNPKSRLWLEDAVFQGLNSAVFRKSLLLIDRLFDEFERRLAVRRWLAGDEYSLAEAAFAPYMIRFQLLGLRFLIERRPALAEWFRRLENRKSSLEIIGWYDPENLDLLRERGCECAPVARKFLAKESGRNANGL
ncbi:MAG: glutathione S-transferase family protein [Albidovulum sp.]|nr:glutathione S-transferase family protein [Albidovulum sp.]